MAENKQYVVQSLNGGTVMISEDVIGSIVANAIKEIDGIAELNVKPGADIAEIFGKKNWGNGMKVSVGENNDLIIDCNISVGYGQSVIDVSKSVQEAVANAVEAMVGVRVQAININVCGVVRK